MEYCVNVKGNVLHVCEVSVGKWLWVFEVSDVYGIKSSGVVYAFEMANCTCVVVSRVSLIERVLIVWSRCLLILFVLYGVTFVNCLLNSLSMSVVAVLVLVPQRMLLFDCVGVFLLDSFAMVSHRE